MPDSAPIGLVLVHGIGEQAHGDTLHKFIQGLSRSFPSVTIELDPEKSGRALLRAGDRTVRVYEAWWAAHLSGSFVEATFREDALFEVVWFPAMNRRDEVYLPGEYSPWLVRAWTAALLPFSMLLNLMLLGARTAGRLVDPAAYRHRESLYAATVRTGQDDATRSGSGLGARLSPRALWRESRARADASKNARSRVDTILDSVAADVTNYVNSAAGAHDDSVPPELAAAAGRIDDAFRAMVAEAVADGCSEIQIVAHSLGTVVAYRCLAADGAAADGASRTERGSQPVPITRFLTIGSPLEKIRFIWPGILERRATRPAVRVAGRTVAAGRVATAADPEGADAFDWQNFAGLFDPVSGKLKRFDLWGRVGNHRTPGLGGLATSHVAYESSPLFMDQLVRGLFGRPAEQRRSVSRIVLKSIQATGENLLMPAVIILLMLAGAASAYATGWGAGFVFGLPLRALGMPAAAEALRHGLGLFALLAITTFAIPAAHNRARELHARFFRDLVSRSMR